MYLEHLSLTDFRSYAQVDLPLEPGVTVLVGANGIGKTNLMEAIGYLATLSSHRVSSDAPLLRFGKDRALVRARLVRGGQTTVLELEINASRANRGRINRSNPVRARDLLGICQTVLFAPEDLALVKGDPSNRRRFLDELLVSLMPRHSATRTDYDRVLKQRNALLKSARAGKFTAGHEATLDVWDQHMARAGAELLHARLALVELLRPHLAKAYAQLTDGSKEANAVYRSTLQNLMDDDGGAAAGAGAGLMVDGSAAAEDLRNLTVEDLTGRYVQAFAASRRKELERGISLVGPHRDELELILGEAPAKGYASHGETWSMCLSLRLASYYVMLDDARTGGSAPILILDDVFAELDVQRRRKLAAIVSGAEQVLVTAAVDADIPEELSGRRVKVIPGGIDE
ncbi:DNA replication/repair protein RecF [Pseudarthrobacter cellobiosi]|uniref:DNA replication/repair protein RecF n=1 Tax=Pseudarthrobacter cellobiosi TaxID=2953654 RepID=UPI00208F7A20|nr:MULTISPECIES: DNA replication/repair protein RecF [unclassified Pseudarthrobacter]MCO4255886.1 DNA replication/repair protein RecF [Pseudarthrobacter sp. HLT1-5]MCO4273349.1 DNA replication/repair protein RecF [Pseudarthrobacter sp. HLT3-5]